GIEARIEGSSAIERLHADAEFLDRIGAAGERFENGPVQKLPLRLRGSKSGARENLIERLTHAGGVGGVSAGGKRGLNFRISVWFHKNLRGSVNSTHRRHWVLH